MRLQASITKSTLSAALPIMYGMEGSHLNHSLLRFPKKKKKKNHSLFH